MTTFQDSWLSNINEVFFFIVSVKLDCILKLLLQTSLKWRIPLNFNSYSTKFKVKSNNIHETPAKKYKITIFNCSLLKKLSFCGTNLETALHRAIQRYVFRI